GLRRAWPARCRRWPRLTPRSRARGPARGTRLSAPSAPSWPARARAEQGPRAPRARVLSLVSGRRAAAVQRGVGLGDGRLAVRGLVLVDDALARGLVQLPARRAQRRSGLLHVAGLGGLAEFPDGRLQRGLDRLVAQSRLLVLPVALDLGFNV